MSNFFELGVDWITCSGPLAESGATVLRAMRFYAGGEKEYEGRFMGYVGWRADHLFYGERNDRWLIIVSGFQASSTWRHLVTLADNVSRIDLQMTVHYTLDPAKLIEEEYLHAVEVRKEMTAYPKCVLIKGDPTGDTFYMGDRSSDYFFRMYDKAAQTAMPEYENCIRYELECKGKVALRVAQNLLALEAAEREMAGFIQSYLHEHRLFPPLPPMRDFKLEPRRLEKVRDEVRIEWLRKQVAPTVARLIEKGYYGDVAEALGIVLQQTDDSPLSS